jgi:hypothetical protein
MRDHTEKVLLNQLVKNLSALYATRRSSPCSQKSAIIPYPERLSPVHTLSTHFFNKHFNIILQPTSWRLNVVQYMYQYRNGN